MNNELIKITNGIATCKQENACLQLLAMFRAVTPQFYKNMNDDDIKAEMMSIKLLTQGIDQCVLAEMCNLAVLNYAKNRSINNKIYFDINYVLTFYKQAFNNIYCNNIELGKEYNIKESMFDDRTNILTEIWSNGRDEKIIKFIDDAPRQEFERHYSPKVYEMTYVNVNNEVF